MTIEHINFLQTLRLLFLIGFGLASFLFLIFTWVGVRRVQLLNRMIHTPLAASLTAFAFLFFMGSVGTLIVMLLLWIVPLF